MNKHYDCAFMFTMLCMRCVSIKGCQVILWNLQVSFSVIAAFLLLQVTLRRMSTAVPGATIHHLQTAPRQLH